jgi:uncharacterized pyridoxal phosphate-containing UPF0001 family protein
VDACGENRVQEYFEKMAQGAYEGTKVHLIGHLQKNKIKTAVGAFASLNQWIRRNCSDCWT